MPFEPPVSDVQLSASTQSSCPNASVSIRKYTPRERTANTPVTSATPAATPVATAICANAFDVACRASSPAAYAPTPK